MAYTLKTNIANKNNYGGKRNTSAIKYIVLHYTGNDGDSDEANARYFKNNIVKASAHYFVDDDSVTQSVPDNYIAWSVGGRRYSSCSKSGGGSMYGKCTNSNSISVELCDTVKNGTVYPSEKTIENAVELVKVLMHKYGIPESNVIRHFDVTGKGCPAYWCGATAKNVLWITEFHDRLSGSVTSADSGSKAVSYLVKITATSLNVRAGAGTSYRVTASVKKNQVYTIIEEKNGWGRLKSGAGWISLKYTVKC